MAPEGDIPRHSEPAASPNVHGQARVRDPAADPQLDQALRAHDRERAIQLIDELFGDGLFRFIYALVRRPDLADDLYQTTLLQAFRDLDSFDARSTLRTWLFSIARHRCLDALKTGKRRDRALVSADELPETADAAPGPEQRLTDAQLLAALGDCLDELLPETRMVLLMRFSEGLPYDDIARVCRANAEAVRARVSRAMPVLRRCIERKGAL